MTTDFDAARQHFLDGTAHLEAGRPDAAEAALLASLERLPGRPSTLLNLAVAQLALGKAAVALGHLDAVLAQEPGDLQALTYRGTALQALGRQDEALAAYAAVLAQDPTQAPARYRAATAALALGAPARALELLQTLCLPDRPAAAPAWVLAGQAHQLAGEHLQAEAAYRAARACDPAVPRAGALLAQCLQAAGRADEAVAVLRDALARGVEPELNRYLLAGLEGGRDAPAASPEPYVRALFDSYAADFESHLVQTLRYAGHQAVVDAAVRAAPDRHWDDVLDLGCGTGLCGRAIRPRARHVVGVDLSPTMLAQAQARGGYDQLLQADLLQHLDRTARRHDLVLAADVFIYVGDLAPVFDAVRRVLVPGGLFCFTVEEPDAGDTPAAGFVLRASLRYAHAHEYLQALALRHGMRRVEVRTVVLREEQRRPISGRVYVLQG